MFDLYPFQQEDVDKLVDVTAGLIGSEMGTGKTHEAIALDEAWNSIGKRPTLVVAPINTHESWREKYAMQAPDTDVCLLTDYGRNETARERFLDAIKKRQADVYIMHWEALRTKPLLRELPKIEFEVIIADEAHRAANRKTLQTRALKCLKSRHRLALSGTATGDRPENLWSVLNWLYPKEYGSYWRFRKHYCIEETTYFAGHGYSKITGVQNVEELHEKLDPFYVRHLKTQACCKHHLEGVMSWLPNKTYSQIWVNLNPTQRRIYEQMRKQMVAWVGEHEESPLVATVVIAQLTRLSQIALATPTLDEEGYVHLDMPSSKIDAVVELIKDADPGKQFVLFSASKQACYLVQKALALQGIEACVLSGDTPLSQRRTMAERFQRGEYQVFVGVIAAAAEGIDGLQQTCDTAIFLDRSWSAIKNKQAEDRLHRDGQKDTVQIIDIMAKDTLDLGRHQRLEDKWNWLRTILGDPDYLVQKELTKVNFATLTKD